MENKIKIIYYINPAGELILGSLNEKLCLADWRFRKRRKLIDCRIMKSLDAEYIEEPSETTDNAVSQLEEYFSGKRKEFDIPLFPVGTDFQVSVWNRLCEIPYGEINTYQDFSDKMGNPQAIRAIAAASGANALSIFIPCHRLIGSNGSLTGYAGGLKAKKFLLELEGSYPDHGQLSIFG